MLLEPLHIYLAGSFWKWKVNKCGTAVWDGVVCLSNQGVGMKHAAPDPPPGPAADTPGPLYLSLILYYYFLSA